MKPLSANHLTATRAVTTLRCVALHLGVAQAVNNACLIKIIGTHLHLYGVARSDLNEVLAELTRDVREHLVSVSQFDAKHSAWEDSYDLAFDFNVFFALCFCHK
jgi:hypothetical protein